MIRRIWTPDYKDWGNPTDFYQTFPYNFYASVWHDDRFVVDNRGYGFAYDDVFDQATLLYEPATTSMKVTLGPLENPLNVEGFINQNGKIIFYPNPVVDILNIKLPEGHKIYQVYPHKYFGAGCIKTTVCK